MKILYKIIFVIAMCAILLQSIGEASLSFNIPKRTPYWQVIMAEAVSEGYEGMYAVGCVLRNRKGSLKGFSGAKRKDLDAFCRRQGRLHIALAKTVEKRVFNENAKDITNGATHFENVEKFGKPYWVRAMKKTAKIGKHTFFKENI